jgi:hypothetical protein
MRAMTISLLMAFAFAPAAVLIPMNPHANTNIIEARVRCGPNARYVRGHRYSRGRYIKGRCVRTTRRR